MNRLAPLITRAATLRPLPPRPLGGPWNDGGGEMAAAWQDDLQFFATAWLGSLLFIATLIG